MSQTARDGFGPDTTTDEVLEGIDLSGQLALITGASGGLGAETARALASKGARVVLTARDLQKGEAAAQTIREATAAEVQVEELELASLASIRAFAERFLAKHEALHILVNNAGVMACPEAKTQDGFELQFGTNHLGHFTLTGLLAPALLRGAPARIVSVSSRGHQQSPVRFDDLAFEKEPYEKWVAYGQSKTANVLFAVELERRLGERGVHANAIHPGVIATDLSRHMQQEDFEHIRKRAGGAMKLKSVESGAATQVYAATAPELDGRGGRYLEDCHVAEVNDDPEAREGVRSYAVDPELAKRLWAVSEELVGQSLPL
ncbi:MAG: oxidoreductase [Proteobacteria bacterium]|nr:oxidoreductase [Pseudomonadota bacterium]